MRRRRVWVPVLAGLIAFATLAGGGTAAAIWSAHAEATLTASAATTAIVSTVGGGLDGTVYSWNATTSSGTTTSAGKVTIENDGSRAAEAQLTVRLQSTDHDADDAANGTPLQYRTAIAQDLRVRFTRLASAGASCTAGTTLPTTSLAGSAGASSTAQLPSDTVAVGASTTICVEVWLPSDRIRLYGPGQITLQLEAALRYASGAAWTVTESRTVTQQILAPPSELFFNNPAARYNILQLGTDGTTWRCITMDQPSYPRSDFDSKPFDCVNSAGWQNGDGNWQYRLVRVKDANGQPTNRYYINWANNVNSSSQPTEPRWTLNAAGRVEVMTASNTDPAQQWILVKDPTSGTFQIKSASAGTCLHRGADNAGPKQNWPGNFTLEAVPCSTSEVTQRFQLSIKGNPYPSPALALSCSAGTSWVRGEDLSWPENLGYQQELSYRIYLDGTLVVPSDGSGPATLDGGTLIAGTGVSQDANGYQRTIQAHLDWDSSNWLVAVSNGTHTIYVQQRIAYGDWYVVATGMIEKRADNNGQVRCL